MATDTLSISALSTVYLCVPVSAQAGGRPVDPTADTVQFAFLTTAADPSGGDWVDGDWEDLGGAYFARCLLGPSGDATLTANTYYVWVKVTDSPEMPVLPLGPVLVVS